MNTLKLWKNGLLALTLAFAASTVWAHEMDATEFVNEAYARGIAEIEAAKLALDESDNEEVRGYADWLIKDHTLVNEKLRDIALRTNIEMADQATLLDEGKAMIRDLHDSQNFSEAYLFKQIKAHEETIDLFQRATRELDPAYQELLHLVDETMPKLQEHHARAGQLLDRI